MIKKILGISIVVLITTFYGNVNAEVLSFTSTGSFLSHFNSVSKTNPYAIYYYQQKYSVDNNKWRMGLFLKLN